ncbi:putative oxidoreductase YdjG [Tetrabaena socialis]|uniref:Putative oxidoreductase YdjG n=1 Tax=Tetrabaena socialis TaxID=47790 RepID=A0A2J8ACV7_9CHLO|nr:putative oxidoreductase YdjG [Tetrabaena socialis]|eukprot:PNH10350.1 putative oxidoreductase YdjG [Tetrabaena socialis]
MHPPPAAAAVAVSAKGAGTFLGLPDVPLLGLGLAALGRPGYINLGHAEDITGKSVDEMRANCAHVLSAAQAMGIRYFDAARSYGRAEEFLGSWLGGLAPQQLERAVVGSKWGYYYTADWQVDTGGQPHEVKEHTAANLAKQADETQGNLGPHLRLYQIHSATLESGVLDAADVLAKLESLKRQLGWKMGLSLSGVQQADVLRKAMSVRMSDGAPLFDCVQATYNLLEQSVGPALLEAHAAGMTVIVKEGLANGRLTPRNTAPLFAGRLVSLQRYADKYGTTVDALALACVIAQPFRPMVLSGATTVQQLASNAAALELVGRLQESDVAALLSELAQPPAQYWAERTALTWN